MDIVYVLGNRQPNIPLKYSLRSLKNIPHDQVVFAGHSPREYRPDLWIRRHQNQRTKWQNSTLNVNAACRSPFVSDDFLLFNDDFYVIQEVTELPSYHRGSTDQMLSELRHRMGVYANGLVYTMKLMEQNGIPGPYTAYDLHTPMIINKKKMLEVMEIALPNMNAVHPCIHIRTLYGNMHSVEAEYASDCKIWKRGAIYNDKIPYLSTSPAGFADVAARLEELFPDKCAYEN